MKMKGFLKGGSMGKIRGNKKTARSGIENQKAKRRARCLGWKKKVSRRTRQMDTNNWIERNAEKRVA